MKCSWVGVTSQLFDCCAYSEGQRLRIYCVIVAGMGDWASIRHLRGYTAEKTQWYMGRHPRALPNQCFTIFIKYSEKVMLYYAIVFLVVALIAAVFGFGGIAVGAAGIAKVLFVVFLIGAVVSFLMHGRSRV
jgi:uncharacterized membrane protein YtjA (UPF0391 family)